jgi:hypothetical protein
MDDWDKGSPLSGPASIQHTTAWVERLIGRNLGDVRVHDSSQAGALAGRLGARAFAVGRDVYIRPDLLHPRTPQGVALLAHELTHAAEQMGGAEVMGTAAPSPAFGGGALPQAPALPAVQRAPGSGSSSSASEARATAVEAAALQALQQRTQGAAAPPDPEQIAEHVYDLIVRDLRLDKERGAHL